MTAVIEQITPHHPKARALLEAMTRELAELYPSSEEAHFGPKQAEGGIMMVAWLNGEAVACGVLRPLEPGVGEIKRVFVVQSCHRQGLARKILTALEDLAWKLGLETIRLETGARQPGAIALYQHEGYRRINCFGAYANDPMSFCFEKQLEAPDEAIKPP